MIYMFLFSYFAMNKDGSLQSLQTGVFRTNCVDCLDRSSVVQPLLARRVLEQQLKHYNVIKYNETIDSYKQLSTMFKNSKLQMCLWIMNTFVCLVWADNADVISLQYAGTGALKTDYTRYADLENLLEFWIEWFCCRTGQRSAMGLLKDGYNSCMRYVLNNFFDGFRQVKGEYY